MSRNFPKIKGYTIKKKIGEGGMASVFLAIDNDLHKMVAIKVFVLNIFGGQKKGKRFLKEARLLKRLRHPNIVNVFNAEKSGEYSYIVMEYLQESLRDILKKRIKLSPREALQICLQVADALFYVHERGIVHRDVKPENIMFRNDFTPILLDFGIVKSIGGHETSLTETGAFIGTPYYMSPEQCSMEKIDGRTDIYSLGIVLYEMLTGRLPYKSRDPRMIFKQHIAGPLPRLSRDYDKIQPLLDLMLAKNKRNRLRSKTRLFDLIKKLLNDKSISSKSGSGSEAKTRPLQKSLQNQKTVQARRKVTREMPSKKRPVQVRKKKKKKKKKNILKKLLLICIFLLFLLVIILKFFFGYTFEEILFGFLNIVLDGLKKIYETIFSLLKKREGI